ncbi:MAG: hypothetical protein CMH26_06890 [Micavibrio sp.]|nr:hypothetical protein [Micavibrio sp.]
MENIQFIEFINTDPFLLFFGAFYLVIGFSFFFARKAWEEFLNLFVQHDSLSLVMGVVLLPISLAIIAFFNDWTSLASIVLMVIGWLALLKSIILLVLPGIVQKFIRREFVQKWLWLDGVSGLIIGAALLLL